MRKENRVKHNEEFQQIINKKRFVSNESFVVYYQINKQERLRVGISVGKKLGNAVIRNKVKRQVRMMFIENVNKTMPLDLIVIVRNRFLLKSYADNRKHLLVLLKKVKMNEYGILNDKEIVDEKHV
ncbi:Ribonuclease P protein component [bioreactor metagenome]|uniref:Ribonuclease P protein component n=1 Tax=bioreactor metagenome TaxID=1076179 RepID=A0A644XS48_9ZZZZ|nr:ribonuclease P protein component [Erysipelotrichaceae bacterium]